MMVGGQRRKEKKRKEKKRKEKKRRIDATLHRVDSVAMTLVSEIDLLNLLPLNMATLPHHHCRSFQLGGKKERKKARKMKLDATLSDHHQGVMRVCDDEDMDLE
jgi:hypothetical protein